MAIVYAGHTSGQNDTLSPFNANVWDWRETGTLTKQLAVNSTLLTNYGKHYITDQYPPTETRVFTAPCITHDMLNYFLGKAKTANSCFTLTLCTGFAFTGRFTDLAFTQLGSDTESSAFYSLSVTLRAIDFEPSDSPRNLFVITDGALPSN